MEQRVKKNPYKIHAGLQIEKIREREKEDSPLTKNPAPPWQLQKKRKKATRHHRGRDLITLLLYLLGFVANDFHIATSNALDALRNEGEESETERAKSCDLQHKQTSSPIMVSL